MPCTADDLQPLAHGQIVVIGIGRGVGTDPADNVADLPFEWDACLDAQDGYLIPHGWLFPGG